MARRSPIQDSLEQLGAIVAPYGPPSLPQTAVEVVQVVDQVGAEYAALRTGCVVIDSPQRGTLAVRGAERIDFLNRMITQELRGMAPFTSRRSFWLTRKGRIDADLRLCELGVGGAASDPSPERAGPLAAEMLIDVDIHAAARAAITLGEFVFGEDVSIADVSEQLHRIELHGPAATAVLSRAAATAGHDTAGALKSLRPGVALVVSVSGHSMLVERQDSTGEPGLCIAMPVRAAQVVWDALRGAGAVAAGWHAFNIARIEAGWPLYYIDFGPDSLPAETGVLEDRVSFKKGCYLGQEVVARMHSLGHPKQRLVGLRVRSASGGDVGDRQPQTGARVLLAGTDEAVGAITSSTVSPRLGSACICFAMMKFKHSESGMSLCVEASGGAGELLEARVEPALAFVSARS